MDLQRIRVPAALVGGPPRRVQPSGYRRRGDQARLGERARGPHRDDRRRLRPRAGKELRARAGGADGSSRARRHEGAGRGRVPVPGLSARSAPDTTGKASRRGSASAGTASDSITAI